DIVAIMAGTHNEESSLLLARLIEDHNISKSDERFWFAQLYGMSDHISFNLAYEGFNVAKYLPYGPVKEVLPYLSRRAQENSSVKGQSSRELSLISQEIKRRKALK
ncbi:MAG: proline dehydrogenase family protein, partial [Bacteroidia bacterium]|nr:proline dehydrogenase family protein [Bacteroidia bacterium]